MHTHTYVKKKKSLKTNRWTGCTADVRVGSYGVNVSSLRCSPESAVTLQVRTAAPQRWLQLTPSHSARQLNSAVVAQARLPTRSHFGLNK